MIRGIKGRVSVSEKVKPLPVKERKTPQLIIGNYYYISFGTRWAYPCRLVEIINEYSQQEIRIRMDGEAPEHIIFPYEIGTTPEEAVKNTQL